MTPEPAAVASPRVLTREQRESYFETGYLHLPGVLSSEWIARLREGLADVVERSRAVTASDDQFVLDPRHRPDAPRLRRMNRAADHHQTFWEYASSAQSPLPDIVADLVGPDVKFREAIINFKWAQGGDPVSWHQDLPFYPHTNPTPLTTLTAIDEVGPDQGPLMVIPGSHRGPVFDHYDGEGRWTGRISDQDLARVDLGKAVGLTGPPGSVTILHGFTLHASERNHSARGRPLMLCGYSSADAFCYTAITLPSRYLWTIVRGKAATHARLESGSYRMPPDWSRGYTSIYETQQEEERAA